MNQMNEMTAETEFYVRRGAEISGIMLAVMVPFFCLGFYCCRRQRRNHKRGLENKTVKKLTTSRHSLSEPPIPTNANITSRDSSSGRIELVSKKSRVGSSFGSSGIGSNLREPDASSGSNNTSEASPALGMGPAISSAQSSSVPGSPSVTSGSAYGSASGSASGARIKRYDGVYYTHEPIRGAPVIEFEEKTMDVEINHRNTEV